MKLYTVDLGVNHVALIVIARNAAHAIALAALNLGIVPARAIAKPV